MRGAEHCIKSDLVMSTCCVGRSAAVQLHLIRSNTLSQSIAPKATFQRGQCASFRVRLTSPGQLLTSVGTTA
jgi:hypothetical protein